MVADVKVTVAKLQTAVSPDRTGVELTRAAPPAAYDPLAATSFVDEYAVAVLSSDAAEVYSASLKASPVDAVKLWVAVSTSVLKLLQTA